MSPDGVATATTWPRNDDMVLECLEYPNLPSKLGYYTTKTIYMTRDTTIFNLIEKEYQRQRQGIELIASENFVSKQILEATGSILTNKYAEGLPGKRYYGGCEVVDEVENLAIARAKQLFNASWANVQPHSGSQANAAVMFAI